MYTYKFALTLACQVNMLCIFVCFYRDLKVVIMGDYAVGKTSFICRYIEGKFKTQEPVSVEHIV